jgi:hypothetical protein
LKYTQKRWHDNKPCNFVLGIRILAVVILRYLSELKW